MWYGDDGEVKGFLFDRVCREQNRFEKGLDGRFHLTYEKSRFSVPLSSLTFVLSPRLISLLLWQNAVETLVCKEARAFIFILGAVYHCRCCFCFILNVRGRRDLFQTPSLTDAPQWACMYVSWATNP